MTGELLDLWRGALGAGVTVAAPFLIAAVAVGLAVAVVQTATQVQESTLSFVPKLLAAAIILVLAGHGLLDQLTRYATRSFLAAAATEDVSAAASPPGGSDLTDADPMGRKSDRP